MSAPAHAALLGFARSSARSGGVHLDAVTLALVLGIVLLGSSRETSASVSIASRATGQPFYYLERQLLLTLVGACCGALMFSIPTALLERAGVALLALAIGLLALVLIPGLGHAVNGSRRWLHLAGVNFQVDRKSTRLNSSHSQISYAVFCLKKKKARTTACTRQVGPSRGSRPGWQDPACGRHCRDDWRLRTTWCNSLHPLRSGAQAR